MATIKDAVLYIGEDIYSKLKTGKRKFKKYFHYYKMTEWAETEDAEWKGDDCFEDMEDLREFFGDEEYWTIRGDVYVRKYSFDEPLMDEEEENYRGLVEKTEGNQMRIKYE